MPRTELCTYCICRTTKNNTVHFIISQQHACAQAESEQQISGGMIHVQRELVLLSAPFFLVGKLTLFDHEIDASAG